MRALPVGGGGGVPAARLPRGARAGLHAAASCLALALALALALSSARPARAQQNGGTDFTADERAQLAKGELVTRPLRRATAGLDLIGGSSWQVIDADVDVVWRALQDTPRYTRLLPRVLEARVVESHEGERDVYIHQGKWPIFVTYYLIVRSHAETRDLRFELDQNRPHSADAAWGFFRLVPYGRGRTLLAFGIAADVGRGIIAAVARGTIQKWMLRVPSSVKKFLENGGKTLYAKPAGGP